ncbi:MAG: hypothetical protein HW412_2507 [Bacteroidetes bacterium]|nr:hypothetical protein [Bacteroidota bacterium]
MIFLAFDVVVAVSVMVALLREVALWKVASTIAAVSILTLVICSWIGNFELGPHIEIEGWRFGSQLVRYLLRDSLMGAGLTFIIQELRRGKK